MIRRAALILLTAAALAFAADATGKWSGEMSGPEGQTWITAFELQSDGTKLTGKMIGGDGQFEKPIENGKVDGDAIRFTVHLDFGDGIDLSYKGKVENGKISFKVQRNNETTSREFVVKRVS